MKDVEQLDDGKLMFHSYKALKEYCDDVDNPLDKVVLGEEITVLNSKNKYHRIVGLFENSKRTNEQFAGIGEWDVSNVTNIACMFCRASNFNQPLDNWNVSNVENMERMFCRASNFNQPLNEWDVSNVEDMHEMFYEANSFNQPLEKWDVSNVRNMDDLFLGAESFNQVLSSWYKKITLNQSDIEKLDDGKLLFHSYEALKKYCDFVYNPLD